MPRVARTVILVAIAVAIVALPAGCGSSAIAPSPSTTTASVATTEGTSATDAAAAKAIQAMADYTSALKKWFHDFSTGLADEMTKAFDFRDPSKPTDSELLRAHQFTDLMRKSVTKLAEISAPPKVANAHAQLYSALRGEVDALERYVNAVDWGSARDAELAMRGAKEAYTLYAQAVQGLSPYVDLAGMTQD